MYENENDLAAALAAYRTTFDARQEARKARATATADELLTPAHRRLLGPVWKLVKALIVQRVAAELDQDQAGGGHVFGVLTEIADLAGVSERQLRRWLHPTHPAARWVRGWISWRSLYGRRDDGLPCRIGTVFRVSTTVQAAGDEVVPAPRPTLASMRAPWRTSAELPSATDTVRNTSSFNGHSLAGVTTFPSTAGRCGPGIRVEGRDLDLGRLTDTLKANTGQAAEPPLTLTGVRASSLWAKAEMVAEKLNDRHSVTFWYSKFAELERVGQGDGAIWAAVGQALEQIAAGKIHRTAGAYAVGVLRNTGSRGQAAPA